MKVQVIGTFEGNTNPIAQAQAQLPMISGRLILTRSCDWHYILLYTSWPFKEHHVQ
jgi:hypothetical protein